MPCENLALKISFQNPITWGFLFACYWYHDGYSSFNHLLEARRAISSFVDATPLLRFFARTQKKQEEQNPFLKRGSGKNWHHTRPRARGGRNGSPNEVQIPKGPIHDPYHTLFGIHRTHEVIRNLIFDWRTICPYEEEKEPHTDRSQPNFQTRFYAWDALFGRGATTVSAVEVLIRNFINTGEDRKNTRSVLEEGRRISDTLKLGTLTPADYDRLLRLLG